MPSQVKSPESASRRASRLGTLAAVASYGMWGLFPLYWKALSGIDPVQILCHRIVWAALLTLALLLFRKGGLAALAAALGTPRRILAIVAVSLLITVNWGVYIWAVNSGRVADSSLGYFINPLLSVALGALFLRERLDKGTVVAVVIAGGGVVYAAIALGSLPWVSLALAGSFALYGLVKKRVGLDPLAGLAAETLVASPFALAFLVFEHAAGRGAFAVPANGGDGLATAMLALAGLVTAIPLLTFAYAANRISLQKMGFIQYISPSSQLALGILVYGERPVTGRLVAFAAVALALIVYASTRRRETATR